MLLLFASCKNKAAAENEEEEFFPALSFIKSQVANVDTSLYSITKIIKKDGVADTTYIKREDFRAEAKDFLTLPDISSDKLKQAYMQSRVYDAVLERVVLNYSPKVKGKEILQQDITIVPDDKGDVVKTIFINQQINKGDSTIEKKMLWQVDKRFQVVTISQKANGPEQIQTLEVIWNNFASAE